ncbi:tyrosine-type recombinase/integrase [Piscinibacter sakaiensis]|uniref:tyrosine-type recombinase/integrase n=1 Tax=Piscinibacter sakaiensis TaxID=1547922 RepID=UPI003AAE0A1F
MPLTDIQVRKAEPKAKPVRLFDSGGLYIEVAPSGGKWWRLKYRHAGKEKRLSLGTYPDTTLKTARERRDQARKLIADGIDPSASRQAEKERVLREVEHDFETVARAWVKHQQGAWTDETKARVVDSLVADIFKPIGAMPIKSIKARHVIAAIKAIEARGASDTAGRVLQRVRAVFRFAVVHEYIETNPVQDLLRAELLRPRPVTHRAALPQQELTEFLAKLAAYDGYPGTLNALRLLMLTAVRPGELRGARWAEFDLQGAQWRIPAERMKMRTEHLVPLSRQALAVLATTRELSGNDSLVFPSPYYPGKPISENTLNSALARMGYKGIATAHGFRALFSTVANEFGHSPDVIERQLAHIERNAVRAAYHRSSYLKDRAVLMQWWADYLDQRQDGENVSPFVQRADIADHEAPIGLNKPQ